MSDGKKCKIGKSSNPVKRLRNLKTANPDIRLVSYIDGDYEKDFHNRYSSYLYDGEWFVFNKDKYKSVLLEFKSDDLVVKDRLNWLIPIGKYTGRRIGSMLDKQELDYLRWVKDNSFNKEFKNMSFWWLENYGRFNYIEISRDINQSYLQARDDQFIEKSKINYDELLQDVVDYIRMESAVESKNTFNNMAPF